MTLGELAVKLLDALMGVQCCYGFASVSESVSGAMDMTLPHNLYWQIDETIADVPCGYHVTAAGYAVLLTEAGEESVS